MTTRKAWAAALATALGAALAATTPFLSGSAATTAYAVLAALGALGVTWRVPNAAHARPGPLTGVLDAVPAALGAPLSALRKQETDPVT